MPMKRYALLVALVLVTLSLKGCVYLRLLEVKLHLSDFEKYFRLEDQSGLDLVFLKPVLLKQDILFLARRGPTFIRDSEGQSTWRFYFQKRGESEDQNEEGFDVPVDLFFDGETLTRVKFPRRFVEILPRPFIVESFRAIGTGEVKKGERHVSGAFPGKKEGDGTPIPSKTHLLKLLGRPTEERRSSPAFAMNYTYLLKPGKPEPVQNPPQAWASFEFHVPCQDPSLEETRGEVCRHQNLHDFRRLPSLHRHSLTGCCPDHLQPRVQMLSLKCLAGGRRHFMELRNGGPPGPERSRGEQWRGEACPPGGHHPSVTP